jgi:hypothetical protein
VLAVVLLMAASGLLVYTARSARAGRARVPVIPPPRQGDPAWDWDAALEHLLSLPAPEEANTPRYTCDGTAL